MILFTAHHASKTPRTLPQTHSRRFQHPACQDGVQDKSEVPKPLVYDSNESTYGSTSRRFVERLVELYGEENYANRLRFHRHAIPVEATSVYTDGIARISRDFYPLWALRFRERFSRTLDSAPKRDSGKRNFRPFRSLSRRKSGAHKKMDNRASLISRCPGFTRPNRACSNTRVIFT